MSRRVLPVYGVCYGRRGEAGFARPRLLLARYMVEEVKIKSYMTTSICFESMGYALKDMVCRFWGIAERFTETDLADVAYPPQAYITPSAVAPPVPPPRRILGLVYK